MIGKHIRPLDRSTGKKYAGPKKRSAVRKLIAYIERETANGRVVSNDFASKDPSLIADQVEGLMKAAGRPDDSTRGRHFLLSWPKADRPMYAGKEGELVQMFKQWWGVEKVFAGTHEDKEHGHVHVFAFELDRRGKPLRYPDIGRGLAEMARSMEVKFGGVPTGVSKGESVSVSKPELEMSSRTGKVPGKLLLRAMVDLAVMSSRSLDELPAACKAYGVEVRFSEHADGGRGVSFAMGDTHARGRDCGWSLKNLEAYYERKIGRAAIAGAGRGPDETRGPAGRRSHEIDRDPARVGPETALETAGGPEVQAGLLGLLQLLQLILRMLGRHDWKDRQFWKMYMAPGMPI